MLDAPVAVPHDRAERRVPRVVGALLLIGAGVIHFAELGDVDVSWLVIGFVLSALSTIAGALLLLTRGPRLGWLLGGIAAGLTLLAFVLSRTVGLPGLHDAVGDWSDQLGIVSIVLEGLAVLLAGWALADRYGLSRRHAAEELRAMTPGVAEREPDWSHRR